MFKYIKFHKISGTMHSTKPQRKTNIKLRYDPGTDRKNYVVIFKTEEDDDKAFNKLAKIGDITQIVRPDGEIWTIVNREHLILLKELNKELGVEYTVR